jgi:hypothetical protein
MPEQVTVRSPRPDELDQLALGTTLSLRKLTRRWNELVGSRWYVVRRDESRIVVRPLRPHHASSDWSITIPQLREHFKILPNPPAEALHLT